MEHESEFVKLLVQSRNSVFSYIYGAVGDYHLAEDLFQEVSVIACRKFSSYEQGTNFTSWLRKIARFEMLNTWKKEKKRSSLLSEMALDRLEELFEQDDGNRDEEIKALEECMKQLPGKSRQIVKLRYTENLKLARIAELVSSSADGVRMILHRIREKLLDCIRIRIGKGVAE